MIVQKLD